MRFRVIASRGLNVRSGPGTNFAKVGALPYGVELISPTIPEGWLPVLYEGGVAWAAAAYLEDISEAGQDEIIVRPADVIYQDQLTTLFGPPRDPAPYLKVVDVREFRPNLGHVLDYLGNPWSLRIYGHELLEDPLRRAMRLLVERGLNREWQTYDGCLNIRPMKGGNRPSVHSWGMAIDLNARDNPYGAEPVLSPEFVSCFTEAGFTWGGTWRTPDGMHFQIPRVS